MAQESIRSGIEAAKRRQTSTGCGTSSGIAKISSDKRWECFRLKPNRSYSNAGEGFTRELRFTYGTQMLINRSAA